MCDGVSGEESMVTILMAYMSGIPKMLEVTLSALFRHDAGYPYRLRLITDAKDERAMSDVMDVVSGRRDFPAMRVDRYSVGEARTGSGQHGRLLDRALQDVNTEFFLTMDSDCFPVSSGWLSTLLDWQAPDVAASGILWPWKPASDDLDAKTIEWRIRQSHCWNNTQPACQLIRTNLMKEKGWKFADSDGDDTNCGFMIKAHEAGYRVVGLIPTRGPLTDQEFDPEMNRHESIIYGDLIYHHVGASRDFKGETKDKANLFQDARDRVYNENGAEWMLQPGNSHVFKMDREDEVAQFKMRQMYQAMVSYLERNDNMFSKNWA